MEWLNVLRDKIKVLFRREQFDRELEEEMQFHQELQAEEHHGDGMSADEARSAARRQFGNTIRLREAGWQAWGWAPLERLFQDLRFIVRSLRRSPGFALSVVLLLALAIWMNTTVFTVVRTVMLAPLAFERPEELVRLYETNPSKGEVASDVTAANFVDWRAQGRAFAGMAAISGSRYTLTGKGEPEQVSANLVTADFFRVLGVRPAIGRTFLPEEYPSSPPQRQSRPDPTVVILSHSLWQRLFGGDEKAVGSTIRLDGKNVPIVGVMPAGFAFTETSWGAAECWLPQTFAENYMPRYRQALVIARRRPGASLEQTQAEMGVIARHLETKRPDANSGWGVRVLPLRDAVVGDYRLSLLVLAGAVAMVLLIACANVANLMLARGAARTRELATRAAIGAGRLRLTQQLVTESIVLSLVAGLVGFALAVCSMRAVVALAPPTLPRLAEVGISTAVFGFCLFVATLTGVVCGIIPALRISSFSLSVALKEGGATTASPARGLTSRILVVFEVALSLVLLVGAALLARSLAQVQVLKLGFQPQHVLTVGLNPSWAKYGGPGQLAAFQRELLPRIQHIPGVESAAMGGIPMAGGVSAAYFAEGTSEEVGCGLDAPSPQYFRALRVPLLKGRLFNDADVAARPQVAMVSRATERRTWPGESAVGKRITFDKPEKAQWMTVVGVVEDVRTTGLEADPGPQVYVPLAQTRIVSPGNMVIRTKGDPRLVLPAVRAALRSLDPDQPLTRVATMEERLSRAVAGRRFNAVLMGVFGALAFVLAASGVYSLMSYTVTLRTREMSIRMALGAVRADILRLIVRNGAVLVGIGVALGLAGALGAVRFLSSLLYQVKPIDPVAFAAATALLVLAALTACYIPARRAASVDVVETLRQE